MAALDDIYQEKLLAYAGEIARNERLSDPDASATVVSRSCGSEVTVDLKLRDGVITDFGQEVEACALGSASASIFARAVIGKTLAEIRQVRARMLEMLKKGGPPPDGDWAELALLEPARVFTNRHQSIMLPFNATIRAGEKVGK
ncbi:MAG: iron-sulfur cluster assembly scaffold protein [Proteobacteria bacterium]|nr:iron-sulfur cluster assembly scaffold protein [Pseudomonadota bacterium]